MPTTTEWVYVRFSVIIPTYNRAATIERAVKSVVCQSCDDWELIVLDDGSTDGTAGIVRAVGHPRIRFTRQENRGVSAARNAGAAIARGDWLVFLDSDDELLPDALSRASAVPPEALLVVWGTTRVSADGTRRENVIPDRVRVLGTRFEALLAGGFAVRASLFETVGGYDEELRYSENTELAWRFRAHLTGADAIQVIDAPLALVHHQPERGHDQSRYDAAKRILERRSYELEADGLRAKNREFRANYFGIAAVSAAELGKPLEALALAARGVAMEPFSSRRYRVAGSVAVRVARRLKSARARESRSQTHQ